MALIEPRATNNLGTEETFILRKLYKERAYPVSGPRSLDLWYDKTLYGKIDRKEDAVTPKPSMMKQLPSLGGTYFVINFVADAFVAMTDALRKGMAYGNVDTRASVYAPIQVRHAAESATNTYYEYLEILDKVFVETYILAANRSDEITNFDLFIESYVRYLYERVPFVPITKSSFVLSKYAIPNISGLVIEIDTENHANDMTKKRSWIDDLNFPLIRKTAQEYGFMIDKNAPWRFVADLSSPFMQKYATAYGEVAAPGSAPPVPSPALGQPVSPACRAYLDDDGGAGAHRDTADRLPPPDRPLVIFAPGSASNIFDTHYDRVYNTDIQLLKKFFKVSYEGFINRYPTYTKKKIQHCGGTLTTSSQVLDRKAVHAQSYNDRYSDSYWVQLYFNLRLREIGIPLTEPRRRVMIKQMLKLLPALGQREIVRRINKRVIDMTPHRWWSWEPNLADSEEHPFVPADAQSNTSTNTY
jgi:hypothetical protein